MITTYTDHHHTSTSTHQLVNSQRVEGGDYGVPYHRASTKWPAQQIKSVQFWTLSISKSL